MIALLLLAAALAQPPAPITLEVRVFDGPTDVSPETRIVVFRAGDRKTPVAESHSGRLSVQVPAGFYDAQAIREQAGRVVSIRWAEQLVVMAYPDEAGHHLEVINLRSGFGALDVHTRALERPEVALFPAGNRSTEAATGVAVDGGVLFVVPAGQYDVRLGRDAATTWHPGIEVPVDRTRFWVAPGR